MHNPITPQRTEIVFVFDDLADWQQLASAGREAGHEVVVLDGSQDGLVQMANFLQGRSGVDAIHILSHGDVGQVQLGSVQLDSAGVAARSQWLAGIGQSLSADGDLLLYGCRTGADDAGRDFVQTLARATGADVAASNDVTGSTQRGGDWVLEVQAGRIQAGHAVSAAGRAAYQGTLAPVNNAPTFAPTAPGTDIGSGTTDLGRSVTVQADGKIVVAGYSNSGGSYNFAVVRYNTDGSLDTGFNGTGKLVTDIGSGTTDQGQSVTVQADGKIVVAGYSNSGGSTNFAVVRYNTDGSLDTGFNGTGKLVTDIGSATYDEGRSVTVQPDGKIVVAGTSDSGGSNNFAVVRYNTNGSLDTTFNSTGKLFTDIGSGTNDEGRSVTVQADGKIVVAGYSESGGPFNFAVVRYNTDGSLDTGFNGTGKLVTDFGSGTTDQGQSVTVQADGKIVVAGYSNSGGSTNFAVVRYNTDGSLDTGFNGTGKLVTDFGSGTNDVGLSVTVQTGGKIVVAGYSDSGGSTNFAVARYNTDGSLDTGFGSGFGSGGKLVTDFGSATYDEGRSVTVQADGKIVVAGYSESGGPFNFAVVRYNTDGSLDTSFNPGPAVNTLGAAVAYTENASAIALDASVAVFDADLAALNGGLGNYSGASVTLARAGGSAAEDVFSALGNLAFTGGNAVLSGTTVGTVVNTGGTLTISFNANATQARVNEVLSSIGYANTSDAPPASVQIDWSFSDGNTGSQGSGGALTATGSTTVNITAVNDAPTITGLPGSAQAVTAGAAAALADFAVTDADGAAASLTVTLTATNGTINGLTDADTNQAGIQLSGTAAAINAAIASATFTAGAAGAASIGVSVSDGIAPAVTGTYHLSAAAAAVNNAPTFALAAPGTGKLVTDIGSGNSDYGYSVTVQPDGKIVVAGFSTSGGSENFAVVRYNTDGSLDTSFGSGGKLVTDFGSATYDVGYSVTVQADGKIVVAGVSNSGGSTDFAVVRYNTDGSLDTGFNGTGKLVTDIGSGITDIARSVTVQADGKIVVAGYSGSGGSYNFAVVRYNANGSLDTGFNGTGKLVTDFGSGADDEGLSVTVQADGKIVVAGYSNNSGGSNNFAVARYNTDGSQDTSFGSSGKLVTDFGSGTNDVGRSVTVQADGKIVVAGYSDSGGSNNFAVVRYNTDGSLDTGFNSTGKLVTDFGSATYDLGLSVTVQADGKIVVAGYSDSVGFHNFAVVRYNTDGSLDTGFNGTGKLVTDFGSATHDVGNSVTVQADGKIVVAGTSNGNFAVVRYNTDGSLDTSFNPGPAVNTLGAAVAYTENASAIALDASVAVFDADLAALNGGAGNYSGASVTLARAGGSAAEDVFSARGNLAFTAGNAVLSGTTVGTVVNTGGTLTISFTANATQVRVNEVLSSIGYANTSDAPPASVQVDWSFSDGNTGSQGSGGALTAAGSTTVNITAVNDAPTVANAVPDQNATQGAAFNFQFAANTFMDVDVGDTLTYSAQLAGGGALPAWLSFNPTTRTFIGTPSIGDVGPLSIKVTANDGNGGTVNDTFNVVVAAAPPPPPPPPPAPAPAPTPPAPPPPAPAPVIDGVPVVTTPGDGGTTIVTIPVVLPTRPDDPTTPSTDLADIPLVSAPDGRPIVQVSVPVGVGLQAEGLPNPVSGEAALAELGLRIERIAGDNAELTNNGLVFYASMDPNEPLVVQTITATPGAGFSPDTPFVITGSTVASLGKQAVILDARALPGGTLIQVDNIDFIAVVGAVRIIGGAGQNIASGDGAAQWIVLGADDDVIRGAGGNDVVASKGGNDRLYGDEGDDAIVGGTGNDHLEGGAGNDILQGGMSDTGAWNFALNADGSLKMSYQASYGLLTDTQATSFEGHWSGQIQDARIAFAYQSGEVLKTISQLHQGLLGELPDLQTMNELSQAWKSKEQAIQTAWNWYEASLPANASTQDKLQALFTQTWGAAQATQANIQMGLDYLAQGGTWAAGLEYLVSHPNVSGLITSEGKTQLIKTTQLGELGWGADSGDDILMGGVGNDVLIGGGGNDVLDGGAGSDMAVFFGAVQHMGIKLRASTAADAAPGQQELVLRDNVSGQEDILRSVEWLQVGGQAYRLELQGLAAEDAYQALAGYVVQADAQELVLVGLPSF